MRDARRRLRLRDRDRRRPPHRLRRARRGHHAFLPEDVLLLPNTSGCETADEAVRVARLARAGGPAGLGQARGDPRPALPAARSGRDAAGRGDARRGRLHGAAVRAARPGARRRSSRRSAARPSCRSPRRSGAGRGLKLRDAIRIMIEQAEVPRRRRRGARLAVARRRGDGARRRRRPRQHGDRARRAIRSRWRGRSRSRVEAGRTAFLAGLMEEARPGGAVEPARGRVTQP